MEQFCITLYRSFRAKPGIYLLIIVSQIASVICILFAVGLIYNTESYLLSSDMDEKDRTLEIKIFELTDPMSVDPFLYEKVEEVALKYPEWARGNPLERYRLAKAEGSYYVDFDDQDRAEWDEWFERCKAAAYKAIETDNERLENTVDIRDFAKLYEDVFGDVKASISSIQIQQIAGIDDSLLDTQGELYSRAGAYSIYSNLDINEYTPEHFIKNIGTVPYSALSDSQASPDDAIADISVTFSKAVSYRQMDELVEKLRSQFKAISVRRPPSNLLEAQMKLSHKLMAFVLALAVAANCGLCYVHIYQSRKKMLAIYRIFGAKKAYCFILCIAEAVLYMAASFGGAMFLFNTLFREHIEKLYPMSYLAYTWKSYQSIFRTYLLSTVFVMSVCAFRYVRRPIIEERS